MAKIDKAILYLINQSSIFRVTTNVFKNLKARNFILVIFIILDIESKYIYVKKNAKNYMKSLIIIFMMAIKTLINIKYMTIILIELFLQEIYIFIWLIDKISKYR